MRGFGWNSTLFSNNYKYLSFQSQLTNCFCRLAASPRTGPRPRVLSSVSLRMTHSVSSRRDNSSAFQCSEFDSKRFLQGREKAAGQKYATNKKYKRRNNIKFNLHFTTHRPSSCVDYQRARARAQSKDRKMSATICLLPQRGSHARFPLFPSPGRPAILIDPLAATPEGRRRPKCLSSTLNFSSHCNCEMPWHFIFILFGQRSILSAISLAYFSPHFLWGNRKKKRKRKEEEIS